MISAQRSMYTQWKQRVKLVLAPKAVGFEDQCLTTCSKRPPLGSVGHVMFMSGISNLSSLGEMHLLMESNEK
ncbi:laccase TilA [Histoplasma capsulatum]|uniref:Laccase TilA n=1 Tax=Ajellomyces capsulatus TaxID=5037 RepID=A0A8A1MHY8_AJECA|nr:laccase TilA [Histoplasma capsulatum]